MSNNKQISVVDFIYNELFVVKRWMDLTTGDIEYIFNKAKAMHKEEMIDAWMDGDARIPEEMSRKEAEYYYNQTFGGNNDNP